ncbi:PREDICTED: uncharacterized protein LOC109238956 [Nicotiana attenuata]|uniref:uncharacterized protein LOC109238956 n=1 Tax=Nicotiana attenuata TaxID=49451 RepID=UPI000904E133|nr:PREDICTED: uncharacterized protein LOC109238956 [Nicotiana attenuata]
MKLDRDTSDNPRAMLVSTAFDGIGYRSWRRSVLRGLFVKNNSMSPQFCQWERCDNMVTSWILNSLSKEIPYSVEYANAAAELWKEFEDRYEQTNGARIAKESMYKAEQDRRLIQFLMGLNEVYTVARGSILMMNPLPSLAQAFSLLVQDEK